MLDVPSVISVLIVTLVTTQTFHLDHHLDVVSRCHEQMPAQNHLDITVREMPEDAYKQVAVNLLENIIW